MSILRAIGEFAFPKADPRIENRGPDRSVKLFALQIRSQEARCLSDRFLFAVSVGADPSRVHVRELPDLVGQHNGFKAVLDASKKNLIHEARDDCFHSAVVIADATIRQLG